MGKNVCVVVLGDIGRSPRMQYHSISLAEAGNKVDIVGYRGATPVNDLTRQPLVSFHYLNEYPNLPLPRFVNYIFKTLWQMISLLLIFTVIRKADYILVQNPPAVPSLQACYIYKFFSGAKLIIDWHNYAYTIMGLSIGHNHILVKLTKFFERTLGLRADYNLCVTEEMKMDLEGSWGIKAITLYDRPPSIFKAIDLEEKHRLFMKLRDNYKELKCKCDNETIFTVKLDDGQVVLKKNRPGLLVSSTSWTEDEDFKVLLNALHVYETTWKDGNKSLPELLVVITGNGPMKKYYQNVIADAGWKHVKVITPWLETQDYPSMLASADLGVSLHTSSSGLDLPMKVVDMFGCQVPVCAFNFKCLHELVQHEKNGFVFNTSEELGEQLLNWFEDFPNNIKQRELEEKFKRNLENFQRLRWSDNWKNVASQIFT